MNPTGQHTTLQRLFALLSVLAVAFGFAPHDPTAGRGPTPLMSPSPLPEMRAAVFVPPLVPLDLGTAPVALAPRPASPLAARGGAPVERPGYRPTVRALTGLRLLEGG